MATTKPIPIPVKSILKRTHEEVIAENLNVSTQLSNALSDVEDAKLEMKDFQITPAATVRRVSDDETESAGISSPSSESDSQREKRKREQIRARSKVTQKATRTLATLVDQSQAISGSLDAHKTVSVEIKQELKEVSTELKAMKDMVSVIKDAMTRPQDPEVVMPLAFDCRSEPHSLMWLKQRSLVARNGPLTVVDRTYTRGDDVILDTTIDVRDTAGIACNMLRKSAQLVHYSRKTHHWIGSHSIGDVVVSKVLVAAYIHKFEYEVSKDRFDAMWEVLCRVVNVPYNSYPTLRHDTYEFIVDYVNHLKYLHYLDGGRLDFQVAPYAPWYAFIMVIAALSGLITCHLGRVGSKIVSSSTYVVGHQVPTFWLSALECTSTVQYCLRQILRICLILYAVSKRDLDCKRQKLTVSCCENIVATTKACYAIILRLWRKIQIFRLKHGYLRRYTRRTVRRNSVELSEILIKSE